MKGKQIESAVDQFRHTEKITKIDRNECFEGGLKSFKHAPKRSLIFLTQMCIILKSCVCVCI